MLSDILFRLRAIFRKDSMEIELEEELRFHVEHEIEKLRASGLSEEVARRQARLNVGGMEQLKEACRDARGSSFVDETLQDLRYAVRMLHKSPAFTTVAVLSLALGIGANTAVFTLMNAVLLKSLPVRNPGELYVIGHSGERGADGSMNYQLYEAIRDRSTAFTDILVFNPNQWKASIDGQVELVYGQCVTGNYFRTLGVGADLGRTLTDEDDQASVAVLGHAYWQRRFGGDQSILGRVITINQHQVTVVGVLSAEFFGLETGRQLQIAVPMSMHSAVGSGMSLREARGFTGSLVAVGRLKPGVSPEQARAQIDVVYQQFMDQWMPGFTAEARRELFQHADLLPAGTGLMHMRKQFSRPLQVLMAMVGLVLLIACANVASLLLARARVRRQEICVRLAIGANRTRIVRQLLTESLLLASVGGVLGLVFAVWGTGLLASFLPQGDIPLVLPLQPDSSVLAFTFVVSLLTGVLFGLAPALRATRIGLSAGLSQRSAGGLHGRTHSGPALGKALVSIQVALSLTLVTCGVLFALSLRNLRQLDVGFLAESVLLVNLDYQGTNRNGPGITSINQALLDTLSRLPGVQSASYSVVTPLSGNWEGRSISVPGLRSEGERAEVRVNWVAPEYFATMGIPLLAGRDLAVSDTSESLPVAVVSETFARQFFSKQDAVGRQFMLNVRNPVRLEIVGVVRDVPYEGLRSESPRMVYLPAVQEKQPRPYVTFELRSNLDSAVPSVPTSMRHFLAH
jgi:predicted permease